MALKTQKLYSFAFIGFWSSRLTVSFLHLTMHREGQISIFLQEVPPAPILSISRVSNQQNGTLLSLKNDSNSIVLYRDPVALNYPFANEIFSPILISSREYVILKTSLRF